MASISKSVLAVVIMKLVESGAIVLDDPINQYLSGNQIMNPDFADTHITMRMLMHHTSSITDYNYPDIVPQIVVQGDSKIPLGTFISNYLSSNGTYFVTDNFGNWEPGSRYEYSNVGAAVAAYVIQEATNKDFDVLAREHLISENSIYSNCAGYRLSDVDIKSCPTIATPSAWNNETESYNVFCDYGYPDFPSGTFRASVTDQAHFLQLVMRAGVSISGKRVLKVATVQEMLAPTDPAHSKHASQGLFWYYSDHLGEKNRVVGHSGGDAGVATDMFYRPSTDIGFVIVTNGDWDSPGFTDAMYAIEAKMLELFDPDWSAESAAEHFEQMRSTSSQNMLQYRGPHRRSQQQQQQQHSHRQITSVHDAFVQGLNADTTCVCNVPCRMFG
jgi:CubicO group peptidase (beta-lactamase class C family)